MAAPTLQHLPASPPDKTGWPWTEQSDPLPETQPDGSYWPKISIVTPSYNQGQFIEETIRSVLLQGYPNLEYIVMDGGSTDESVEIIQKYEPWIDYWVSEEDEGQSDAINKGFEKCTGDWGGWINSDDFLAKQALQVLGKKAPDKIVSGACTIGLPDDESSVVQKGEIYTAHDVLNIVYKWRAGGYIPQPSTFFPVQVFLKVGGLDQNEEYVMDYDLWCRLTAKIDIEYTDTVLAHFRTHDQQKTNDFDRVTEELISCAVRNIRRLDLPPKDTEELIDRAANYDKYMYEKTGRLARSPLPKSWVVTIRKLTSLIRGQNT